MQGGNTKIIYVIRLQPTGTLKQSEYLWNGMKIDPENYTKSWKKYKLHKAVLSQDSYDQVYNIRSFLFWSLLFFFSLLFLGLHQWHREVPRLGDQIRAVAAGLRPSPSNARSELCLQPTQQVTAMPDP